MWFSDYKQPTVAQQKVRAEKALVKLRQNNSHISPVIIEDRTISKTWWGKAWNHNIDSYSDYSNRLGRGRSYVRNNNVLDLQITEGKVNALVAGSRGEPYEITITIHPLNKNIWEKIRELSTNRFESIPRLLKGEFPPELQQVFSAKKEGLFPSSSEISFDCTCPDWASMCKHVAAVLYGIGNRLDYHPELLFLLRGVKLEDLIECSIENQKKFIIEKAQKIESNRIIPLKSQGLGDLFDINFKE